MATKRKIKKITRNILAYLVVAVFVISIAGFSVFKIVDLKMESNELHAQQKALLEEKEKLTEQLKNVNNPEYIEQEARKQLKMIMPGETLYILQDDKNDN